MSENTSDIDLRRFGLETICASVTEQKADLRNTRNQASIVAAVNGLIATFCSRLVIGAVCESDQEKLGDISHCFSENQITFWLAIFTFGFSIVFAAKVILPRQGWVFDLRVVDMIETLEQKKDVDFSDHLLVVIKQKQKHFDCNENMLRSIQSDLFFALMFAVAQIPFWLLFFI